MKTITEPVTKSEEVREETKRDTIDDLFTTIFDEHTLVLETKAEGIIVQIKDADKNKMPVYADGLHQVVDKYRAPGRNNEITAFFTCAKGADLQPKGVRGDYVGGVELTENNGVSRYFLFVETNRRI